MTIDSAEYAQNSEFLKQFLQSFNIYIWFFLKQKNL